MNTEKISESMFTYKTDNRITLYNRTINPLVLFIYTVVAFGVFDIIYFHFALKLLDTGRFLWSICCKNEIQTKALSSKYLKTLHIPRNKTAAHNVPRISIKVIRYLKLIK